MLNDTVPKCFFGKCVLNHNTPRLSKAPARLSIKVGDRNCPSNRLLANTRSMLTQAALAKPYLNNTYKVTMFAMPGFTPGSGDGITASSICNAMATVASLAMRWSSMVVLICIVNRASIDLSCMRFTA